MPDVAKIASSLWDMLWVKRNIQPHSGTLFAEAPVYEVRGQIKVKQREKNNVQSQEHQNVEVDIVIY